MGLLDKALVHDNSQGVFSPDLKKMIAELNTVQKSFDFPTLLFSHLKQNFQIIKGALLLPLSDSQFVPWAETGFDRTTSRRIRIPVSIVASIKNNNLNIIKLSGSDIEIMRDYFSFREFSVTKNILIAPLILQQKIIAILFITDGEVMSQPWDKVKEIFESLSKEAGLLLYNKRDSLLKKMDLNSDKNKKCENIIKQFINKVEDKSFLLVSIELNNYIETIKKNDPDSITFRIKQDITRLIKTLISEKGEVVDTGVSTILILLEGDKVQEAELFVHQIGLSIGHFYKKKINKIKPFFKIKRFPEDGKTSEDLINSLQIR